MLITALSKEHEDDYSYFVSKHPKSLIYYTLKYRELLMNLLKCKEEYYILIDDKKIRAVLPILFKDGKYGRVYNSLAYFGSNGSILAENEIYYNKLLEKYNDVIETSAASTYVENPLDIHEKKPNYHFISQRVCQFNKFEIDMDMDNLSLLFTSNKRNDIRKAIKNNIHVEIDNSQESKDFLYETHVQNMQAIKGKPKDKLCFDLIFECFEERKEYNIFIAKKDDQIIASLLVLYFNDKTEYYTPVVSVESRSLQPLAIIIYESMKYSFENGKMLWNWGGNGISLSSVYDFKKRWNATDFLYNYYIKFNNKDLLNLRSSEIMDEYNGFFVIPFNIIAE